LEGRARCVMCDQRLETLDHLLVQCPSARAIWFHILHDSGFASYTPQADSKFLDWWCSLNYCQPKARRKDLASICIAVSPRIWLERNNHVFDRAAVTDTTLVRLIREDQNVWKLARRAAAGREEWRSRLSRCRQSFDCVL
jgi:hypothetical protein